MIFNETPLPGVFHITAEPNSDERGSFSRLFCSDEFAALGINFSPVQVNLSKNLRARTLRGLHFQREPHGEEKLVQVTAGRIWDVAVDLRPGPTQGQWWGTELSRENGAGLYLPKGIAHGFITLEANSDVLYHMGQMFVPGHGAGIVWNDTDIGIDWPFEPDVINDRDQSLPTLNAYLAEND